MSPMASPFLNSITVKGISDPESALVGATSVLHSEAAGLAVTLSREMDVLYDPLESESGAIATLQNEAYTLITEYDLPSLPQECMDAQMF